MTVSKRAAKLYKKAKRTAGNVWNFRKEWAKAMRKAHKEIFSAANRISRKERAARFTKLYNSVVEMVIKVGYSVNLTEEITDDVLKAYNLNISKNYFLIMFRDQAKNDSRVAVYGVQKKGTFCEAC